MHSDDFQDDHDSRIEINLEEETNGGEGDSEKNVWELEEDEDLEKQVAELGGSMEAEEEEGSPQSELKAKYLKQKKDIAELRDRLLRMAADFDNYRKRVSKERNELVKYCNENLIIEILPIKDDLERAAIAGKQDHDTAQLLEGIDLILANFDKILKKNGIESMNVVGQKFDPNYHEAMSSIQTNEVENNTIIEEYKRGYMLHDKLLRPAQVVVSSKPNDKPNETED